MAPRHGPAPGDTIFFETVAGAFPPPDVAFYIRRLPHWQPQGAELLVTWHLHGSWPSARIPDSLPAGQAFALADRELDRATTGPLWLKDPPIADCVTHVLLSGAAAWKLYELHAWVVMANHVHLLVRPLVPLRKALMNIKSASAREANALLGRKGSFWQDESYDHWVRNSQERSPSSGISNTTR